MDIKYSNVVNFKKYKPLNKDAQKAIEIISEEVYKDCEFLEIYIQNNFVGYAGVLPCGDGFSFSILADTAFLKHKKTCIRLMQNVLKDYTKYGVPLYAHVSDNKKNQKLAEFLGFKKTNIFVQFGDVKFIRWVYDRH